MRKICWRNMDLYLRLYYLICNGGFPTISALKNRRHPNDLYFFVQTKFGLPWKTASRIWVLWAWLRTFYRRFLRFVLRNDSFCIMGVTAIYGSLTTTFSLHLSASLDAKSSQRPSLFSSSVDHHTPAAEKDMEFLPVLTISRQRPSTFDNKWERQESGRWIVP